MIQNSEFRIGVVSGESGTGKTSLIQAGIMGIYGQDWKLYNLVDYKEKVLSLGFIEGSIVILDQFEQIFDSKDKQEFYEKIQSAKNTKILILIRSEYLDRLQKEMPILTTLIRNKNYYYLRPLDETQTFRIFQYYKPDSKFDLQSIIQQLSQKGEIFGTDIQIVLEILLDPEEKEKFLNIESIYSRYIQKKLSKDKLLDCIDILYSLINHNQGTTESHGFEQLQKKVKVSDLEDLLNSLVKHRLIKLENELYSLSHEKLIPVIIQYKETKRFWKSELEYIFFQKARNWNFNKKSKYLLGFIEFPKIVLQKFSIPEDYQEFYKKSRTKWIHGVFALAMTTLLGIIGWFNPFLNEIFIKYGRLSSQEANEIYQNYSSTGQMILKSIAFQESIRNQDILYKLKNSDLIQEFQKSKLSVKDFDKYSLFLESALIHKQTKYIDEAIRLILKLNEQDKIKNLYKLLSICTKLNYENTCKEIKNLYPPQFWKLINQIVLLENPSKFSNKELDVHILSTSQELLNQRSSMKTEEWKVLEECFVYLLFSKNKEVLLVEFLVQYSKQMTELLYFQNRYYDFTSKEFEDFLKKINESYKDLKFIITKESEKNNTISIQIEFSKLVDVLKKDKKLEGGQTLPLFLSVHSIKSIQIDSSSLKQRIYLFNSHFPKIPINDSYPNFNYILFHDKNHVTYPAWREDFHPIQYEFLSKAFNQKHLALYYQKIQELHEKIQSQLKQHEKTEENKPTSTQYQNPKYEFFSRLLYSEDNFLNYRFLEFAHKHILNNKNQGNDPRFSKDLRELFFYLVHTDQKIEAIRLIDVLQDDLDKTTVAYYYFLTRQKKKLDYLLDQCRNDSCKKDIYKGMYQVYLENRKLHPYTGWFWMW